MVMHHDLYKSILVTKEGKQIVSDQTVRIGNMNEKLVDKSTYMFSVYLKGFLCRMEAFTTTNYLMFLPSGSNGFDQTV